MAAHKDKGLVGGASDLVGGAKDRLRKTTGGLGSGVIGGGGPWHSVNSEVYHDNPSCQTGNSIAPENVRQGTGEKQLCGECEKLNSASGPVGDLTGL